jgi:phospholipid transport system transporter-binding protein
MNQALPSIEHQQDNRYLIKGELNMQTVPALAVSAKQLLANAEGELNVDLSGVSRADSAGLVLLIELQRLARQQKFTIRFSHLPEQLGQIMRLSELHEILPILN